MNEETGATWALIKFPPGIADKIHTHPKANQLILPMSGPNAGKVARIDVKGDPHGGSHIEEEIIGLFYWDGPPDPVVVE
jgi:hypothetical protein